MEASKLSEIEKLDHNLTCQRYHFLRYICTSTSIGIASPNKISFSAVSEMIVTAEVQ